MSIIKQIKDSNNIAHDIHALNATKDGDGNTISSTYAKLNADNAFNGNNEFSGNNNFIGTTVFTGDTEFNGDNNTFTRSVTTPILHLDTLDGEGTGGKIVFGDISGELDDHDSHYVCIEEIEGEHGDELAFTANKFTFNNGTLVAPALHISPFNDPDSGTNYGGKIVFSNYDETYSVENHAGHYVCIEENENDELEFTANNFYFNNGTIYGEFEGNLEGNATTADSAVKATKDGDGNTISSTYAKIDDDNVFSGNNYFQGTVGTQNLHLKKGNSNFGGKIIFGDVDNENDIETHEGHFACIEELNDDELTFRAGSGFKFEGGEIYGEGFIGRNISLKNEDDGQNIIDTWTIANNGGSLGISYANSSFVSFSKADIIKFDNVRDTDPQDDTYCDIHVNGTIITPGNDVCVLRPAEDNYDTIGSEDYKFWKMYATTFYGDLSGTANKAKQVQVYSSVENKSYPLVFSTVSGSTGSTFGQLCTGAGSAVNIFYNPSTNKLIGLDGISSHSLSASSNTGYGFAIEGRSSNPYIRLAENGKSGYFQLSNGTSYFGSTLSKSLAVDSSGNVTLPLNLNVSKGETILDGVKADSIYVSDAVNSVGGFYETSDGRLKDIVKPLHVNLEKLSKLRKVYFTWKDSQKHGSSKQLGMIAQDVQELYPELVHEKDGQLSLAYDKLSVIALEAIDVLHNENNELKNRIDVLHNENNELKNRIDKLESLFNKLTEN